MVTSAENTSLTGLLPWPKSQLGEEVEGYTYRGFLGDVAKSKIL